MNKPNLVLDLDETLIKSLINFKVFDSSFKGDFILDGNVYNIYFRNNAEDFIDEMYNYFNIYIYSNGTLDYVNNILNMFINRYKIKGVYARKDLNEDTMKCLRKYNLSLEDTLIIDDRIDVWTKESSKKVFLIRRFEYYPKLSVDNVSNSMLFPDNFTNRNCLNIICLIIKKYYSILFKEFSICLLKMISEYLLF